MTEPQRFILDTSALIQRPEILAQVGRRDIVIPHAVLSEISSRGRREPRAELAALIQDAIARGANLVEPPKNVDFATLATETSAWRLAGADIDIASIATDYAKRFSSSGVVVVTSDRALQAFLLTKGIESITATEFLHYSQTGDLDRELHLKAKSFNNKRFKFSSFSTILAAILSALGQAGFTRISYLATHISVWGTVIALPILGIFLYWYRQRFRLSYGLFEFIVGTMTTYAVFFPNFDYAKLTPVQGIQLLGGLYVMVRGMDNISKGVEGTRAEATWKRVFSS